MNLDTLAIMKLLPHRYPFLLVDRIVDLEPGKRAVGVLIIEAMAQVGGVVASLAAENGTDQVPYFTGIDKARFRRPVMPGDVLRLELEMVNCRRGLHCFEGKAFVDGVLVAEAELKAVFAPAGKD